MEILRCRVSPKNEIEGFPSQEQLAEAERRSFQPHYRQGGATTERQWLGDTIKRIVIVDVRAHSAQTASHCMQSWRGRDGELHCIP